MIKSSWACWIDESPPWNLVCFQVVQSCVWCLHCNELNLHFLKTVYAAHNLLSHKDNRGAVVVLGLVSQIIATFMRNMKDYMVIR